MSGKCAEADGHSKIAQTRLVPARSSADVIADQFPLATTNQASGGHLEAPHCFTISFRNGRRSLGGADPRLWVFRADCNRFNMFAYLQVTTFRQGDDAGKPYQISSIQNTVMTISTKITGERMNLFDFRNYSAESVGQLASQFQTAEPFPHVVFENFLNLRPDEMAGVYPAPEWPHWNNRNDYYQSGKMYCRDTDILPPLISSMFYELSSPPFLRKESR
jgi:hypothetical protein